MLNSDEVSRFTETLKNKTIVVDTSSLLLSGVNLLTSLPVCTLIIPSIVVKELEEKRTQTSVGFAAREWLRLLEKIRSEKGKEFRSGVKLNGYEHVTLKIEPNHSTQTVLPNYLQDNSNDSTILAVAKNFANEGEEIIVLSNDMPMLLHATLDLNLEAIEYNSALITGRKPFNGKITLTITEEEYSENEIYSIDENHISVQAEEYINSKIKNTSHSLVSFRFPENEIEHSLALYENGTVKNLPRKLESSKIVSRNLEQALALYYLDKDAEELPIVSIAGGAGTGKTLLSVAKGIEKVRKNEYKKIIVFRSLHEMGKGQELGFLPGTVDEKMEAWAGAIYDAVDVIASEKFSITKKVSNLVNNESDSLKNMIEVSPISYLRGRSLSNSYLILDEAQNFSRNELLNIISRAGVGTKIVLCSDSNQVDNKYLPTGNKAEIWAVINDLRSYKEFAHITLLETERSKVAEIASDLLSS